MQEILVPIAIGAIRVINYVYELIAWPVHSFLKDRHKRRAVEALPSRDGDPSTPWRNVRAMDQLTTTMFPGSDTVCDLWTRQFRLNPEKDALGTREILAKHVEVQANGREFVKLELGEYHWESFAAAEQRVNNFGQGLIALGLKPRIDRVLIYAETRAEWMIAAQACFRYSFTMVTLYATLGEEALLHGIEESQAKIVITSDDLLPKLSKILPQCAGISRVIFMSNGIFNGCQDVPALTEPLKIPSSVSVIEMTAVERQGSIPASTLSQESREAYFPKSDQLAIIMYTSGSTGIPKGVMMTHGNLMAALTGMHYGLPHFRESDIYVAYLPLAHVLELACEIYVLSQGSVVGYSSPQTLTDSGTKLREKTRGDVIKLRPTHMTCVPTILDRLSKTVWEKVNDGGAFACALFKWSYKHKEKRLMAGYRTPFLDRLLFGKIRGILGGRIRYMLCGGAPLSHEAQQFVYVCFSKIIQGYGLTETSGAGTLVAPGDLRTEHAGVPLTSLEITLRPWVEGGYSPHDKPNPRGEVLIGGPCVSLGYYNQPEKTAEDFFTDGQGRRWFCSGDIGLFEPDGNLKIIDRKKDLVKLQHGEYVSLGKVELALSTCPLVESVCIYGDPRHEVAVAIVVPKKKQLVQLAEKIPGVKVAAAAASDDEGGRAKAHQDLCHDPLVVGAVLKELQKVGITKNLQRFELPGHVYLHSEPWTPDTGFVTDAFKLKRRAIQEHFQANIDRMYSPTEDSMFAL